MRTVDTKQLLPSMYSVQLPIQQYRGFRSEYYSVLPVPEVSLSALDGLLTHLLLSVLPRPFAVQDTACRLTQGESSLLFVSHPFVEGVIVDTPREDFSWKCLTKFMEKRSMIPTGGLINESLTDASAELLPRRRIQFAHIADSQGGIEALVESIESGKSACVILAGLGKALTCPHLAKVTALTSTSEAQVGSILVRECSDAFFGSSLLILHVKDDPIIPEAVERIVRLYSGNFDYIDLVSDRSLHAIRQSGADAKALGQRFPGHPWLNQPNTPAAAPAEQPLPIGPPPRFMTLRKIRHKLAPQNSLRNQVAKLMLRRLRAMKKKLQGK